ncbi:hypothetical protein TNIN_139741, partial [Trichonephila inaurata madagascariensis]
LTVFKGVQLKPSRREVVFLKLIGIGNSAFLLALAFAYLFAMRQPTSWLVL